MNSIDSVKWYFEIINQGFLHQGRRYKMLALNEKISRKQSHQKLQCLASFFVNNMLFWKLFSTQLKAKAANLSIARNLHCACFDANTGTKPFCVLLRAMHAVGISTTLYRDYKAKLYFQKEWCLREGPSVETSQWDLPLCFKTFRDFRCPTYVLAKHKNSKANLK